MGVQHTYKNIEMLDASQYIGTAQRLGLDYNNGGFDTDFPQSITRTGWVQSHHVAFSGGDGCVELSRLYRFYGQPYGYP